MFKHVITAISLAAAAVAAVQRSPSVVVGRKRSPTFMKRFVDGRSHYDTSGVNYPQHGRRECERRLRQRWLRKED